MNAFRNFFRNWRRFPSVGGLSSNQKKLLTLASCFLLNNLYNQQKLFCWTKQEFDKNLEQYHNVPQESDFSNVILLAGNANPLLAKDIARILGVPLGNCKVGKFADGEVSIQINDNVRGKDVFVIQPTCAPVNENLIELLLLISTLRRASARRINVLIPYYGYSRQDRKIAPRVPISAADVARLLETMGVDRVISVDLHCGQIQGFFSPRVPVDNLEGNIVAVNYFLNEGTCKLNDYVIVSPDAGGVGRAKKFQELFNFRAQTKCGLAMIIKQREAPGKIAQMNLVGNVQDKNAIIVDDMIDTAGTLYEAAKVLKEHGANRVFTFATHGLFSGKAFDNIANSCLEKVIVSDTTPRKPGEENIDKIIRLSVAPLLADAIYRIQFKRSISSIFEFSTSQQVNQQLKDISVNNSQNQQQQIGHQLNKQDEQYFQQQKQQEQFKININTNNGEQTQNK